MARYKPTIETQLSQAVSFAYLSDFSTTEEWNPGVVEASRRVGDRALSGLRATLAQKALPILTAESRGGDL